jgi:hypothetical protein
LHHRALRLLPKPCHLLPGPELRDWLWPALGSRCSWPSLPSAYCAAPAGSARRRFVPRFRAGLRVAKFNLAIDLAMRSECAAYCSILRQSRRQRGL